MIQRFLFSTITEGIQIILGDPKLMEDIFGSQMELSATELAAIKRYFLEKTPDVINGYARQDTQFPAVAIVLADERETQGFLGYEAGMDTVETSPTHNADLYSELWSHTYLVFVYADNPEVCLWIYEMVKAILWEAFDAMFELGIHDIQLTGRELAPDPQYIPEHLFVRQLSLQCQREYLMVDRSSLRDKAFQVAGMHVDKSGSPSDVGGVKTLVTPYSEGEDGA